MPNKLPKFFDKHKICIICEGNEEYEYLKRLKDLNVWNEQYEVSLVNAGGNGNIPARYQDRYQNGADELTSTKPSIDFSGGLSVSVAGISRSQPFCLPYSANILGLEK